MRTWVYIDGFNLYYAIKQYGKKWIDIKRLAEEAMPDGTEVHKVKYYTARVSGAIDPDQPRRQQIYLKALQTIPEVEIFFGNFLSRPQWKPLLNLPVAERSIHSSDPPVRLPAGEHLVSEVAETGGETFELLNIGSYPKKERRSVQKPAANALRARIHTMEEKGSDVNLACHLINDAWKDCYDQAVIITNDTDLVEPIRIVTQERARPVTLLCPMPKGAATELKNVATHTRHIREAHVTASQFPDTLPITSIRKPNDW